MDFLRQRSRCGWRSPKWVCWDAIRLPSMLSGRRRFRWFWLSGPVLGDKLTQQEDKQWAQQESGNSLQGKNPWKEHLTEALVAHQG
ncbi:unnamed protein product [Boreogadus saida]